MESGIQHGASAQGPSFSLGNRLARAAWGLVWATLFRPSPRPLHGWRRALLRLFGAQIGRDCHVYPRVRIWAPWNLACADRVAVADDVILYNQAPISLGQGAVISQGSHLCTGTHDYTSPGFDLIARPIRVGAQAWVAADCFVGPGVTIGKGAVIGARSVVLQDMPERMVCAGHPCRSVKPRERRSKPCTRNPSVT